jgi:hypothetical protein
VSAEIGSLAKSLLVRPHTDPASALATLAAQAPVLVEWGWLGGVFRARPLLTSPNEIHDPAKTTCYLVDAEDGDIIWDVAPQPDAGTPRSVRLIYGHTGKTIWPPGTPAQVVAPSDPGLGIGTAFMGTTAPMVTVDFSQQNFTEKEARSIATALAGHLGIAEATGPCSIHRPTLSLYGGGTRPVPYMHGGDWVEAEQGGHGPLYVTRARVDADTGYVDCDLGLSSDALIDQLEAAGRIRPVPLHKPYKKKNRR